MTAADRYALELSLEAAAKLRLSASALRYSSLEAQVRRGGFDRVEFLVARER